MKKMMALAAVCAALAFPWELAAAQQADGIARFEMKYDAGARDRTQTPRLVASCTVYLEPTEDGRQNQTTIGGSMTQALVASGVTPWMTEALMGLQQHGYRVLPVAHGHAMEPGVVLKTRVTRAYTWPFSMKIFGILAVHAQFTDLNGVTHNKYYRALGDKTNLNDGVSEYGVAMNYSVNNLQTAVARDLQRLCKSEPVDAFTYAGPDDPLEP